MEAGPFIFEARGITKTFPGVKALDGVDFQLKKGEIHALVGENGAGKSTFAKILAGVHTPSSGKLYLAGQEVTISHPLEAINMGIGMVHQERNLVPFFNAVENIYLNQEITSRSVFLRPRSMKREVTSLMEEIGLAFELDTAVSELGPSKQQMAEILKVLLLKPKIIIFDEPTSSLSKSETQLLFKLLRKLKQDLGVIFISHRLDEIFEICDRITVFRDGKRIGTVDTSEVSQEQIIEMMVAREIKDLYPRSLATVGGVVLEGKNIRSGKLQDISFKVREGEIVGLSGMVGSGRTELAETIFGLRRIETGEIIFKNQRIKPTSPSAMIKRGLYLIPEDRRVEGLNLQMTVKENLSMVHLGKMCFGAFIQRKKENQAVEKSISEFDIRVTGIQQIVENLSGGNQQKVVIGKWLQEQATVLFMDEATAGIDVGAKREIYKIMIALAEQGVGIVFISSDLPELMGVSDRIYVMNDGTITAEFIREDFSQQAILEYAIKDSGGK